MCFLFLSGVGFEEAKACDKVNVHIHAALKFLHDMAHIIVHYCDVNLNFQSTAFQIQLEDDVLFCSGILMLPLS